MTRTQMSPRRRQVSALGAAGTLVGGAGSALLLALASSPVGATGTTFTVDTLDDGAPQPTDCTTPVPGSCSLRDALYATSDGDTVTFISGLTGTIDLDDQLKIGDVIVIDGPGAASLTIDAGGTSRVFYVCSSGAPATISGMTITGGNDRKGAGVYEESCGGVILREVVISGNVATRYGGGVYANAELWIYDSEISGNTAPTYGGGVYAGSDLVIANSTIVDNSTTQSGRGGGGVFASGTTMIEFSTFARNSSAGAGGGLYFHGGGDPLTITNSVFAQNEAEGGGGAFIESSSPMVVANSTFTANVAGIYGGGGLEIDGLASLLQVTIVGNRALGSDAFDTGGGVHLTDSSTVTLSGAIISGNTSASGADDIGMGNANSNPLGIASDNSLLGDVDGRVVVNGTGNISSLDPMVGPLADNGGRTATMALLPGSPAIDAGPNPVATFPGNRDDQRGNGFARVFGGQVDIGAFEVQPMPEPTTTTTTPSGPVVPTFTG